MKHYLYHHKIILPRAFSLSTIGSDYYLAMVLVVVEVLSTVMLRFVTCHVTSCTMRDVV